ncbi:unnamed protein product [Prorocentrum cordatum]|uniref:Uncharacterized protein n=1 Tax=Prorocentrum cordatum TaxID=2364126 RepID=A0ABN9TFF4_9DINO|nr:unnamed protein product [Polarella glacialis]|mmetsp:Transcript_12701/g.33714  ORF Transcript_12701/g.33714 Transcript_12701/m.33714 type:complete len:261 (-) Transcript_12701:268-1050(-)
MPSRRESLELVHAGRVLELDESQSEESESTDEEAPSRPAWVSLQPALVASAALCVLFVTVLAVSAGSGDVEARLGRLRGAAGVPSGMVSAPASWSKSAAAAGGVMTAGLLKVSFGCVGHCCGVIFNTFGSCVNSCWTGVMNCTGSICGAFSGLVGACCNAVGACFGSLCNSLTACLKGCPLCGDALAGCSKGASHCIGGIYVSIGKCFSSMWQGLSSCILGICDKCAGCVASMYNSIVGCFASIWGSFDRCCASCCSCCY